MLSFKLFKNFLLDRACYILLKLIINFRLVLICMHEPLLIDVVPVTKTIRSHSTRLHFSTPFNSIRSFFLDHLTHMILIQHVSLSLFLHSFCVCISFSRLIIILNEFFLRLEFIHFFVILDLRLLLELIAHSVKKVTLFTTFPLLGVQVHQVTIVESLAHQITLLIVQLRFLHFLGVFKVYSFLKIGRKFFLLTNFEYLSILLLFVVGIYSVLLDGGPFIYITFGAHGVVTLALRLKIGDLLFFILNWLFDAVL